MSSPIQPNANLYSSLGNTPSNVINNAIRATRAPSTTDIRGPNSNYPIGQRWIDTSANKTYTLTALTASQGIVSATWLQDGGSGSGGVDSITGTANQITASASTGDVTLSLPLAVTAPGSLITTTTFTATLGNITATNGDVVLGTPGNMVRVVEGANASVGGTAAMVAGVITTATTACSATARIFYVRVTAGGTLGEVSITAQDATGFTLTSSSNTETSTFNYWIINA